MTPRRSRHDPPQAKPGTPEALLFSVAVDLYVRSGNTLVDDHDSGRLAGRLRPPATAPRRAERWTYNLGRRQGASMTRRRASMGSADARRSGDRPRSRRPIIKVERSTPRRPRQEQPAGAHGAAGFAIAPISADPVTGPERVPAPGPARAPAPGPSSPCGRARFGRPHRDRRRAFWGSVDVAGPAGTALLDDSAGGK
jgi:hypothetical protein